MIKTEKNEIRKQRDSHKLESERRKVQLEKICAKSKKPTFYLYTLYGVEIKWPFPNAYPSQISIMKEVIAHLLKKRKIRHLIPDIWF